MRGFNIFLRKKKKESVNTNVISYTKNQFGLTEMDFKLTNEKNYTKIFKDLLELKNKKQNYNFNGEYSLHNTIDFELKKALPEEIDEFIKNVLIFCRENEIPVSIKHTYNRFNGVRNTVSLILMTMDIYEDKILNDFISKEDIHNLFPINPPYNYFKDYSYLSNLVCIKENIFYNIKNELADFLETEEVANLFHEISNNYKSSRFYKKIKQNVMIARNVRDVVFMKKQCSFNTQITYYNGDSKRIYKNLVLLYELDLALENFLVAKKNQLSMDLVQTDDNIFNRCRFVLNDDILIKAICSNIKLVKKAIQIYEKNNQEKELILKLIEADPEKIYYYLNKTKFATDKDICIKTIQKNPELVSMVVKYGILDKKEINEIIINYIREKNKKG